MNKKINNQLFLKNKKQKVFLFLISFLLIFLTISTIIFLRYRKKTQQVEIIQTKEQPPEKLTIFTHGSFGSLMGLINFFDVINDDISKTKYKKIISKMRKASEFYRAQPIMQRGLIKIEPSFNLSSSPNTNFATYPLIKAYQKLDKNLYSNQFNNKFYTFGWSGLLSQSRRRKEAIRFYNALSEELKKFNNQKTTPIIRIISHSHGGNLTLNLAAVHTVINNFKNIDSILHSAINNHAKETLRLMYEEIKKLPQKSNLKKFNNQKRYDYFPEEKNISIDEFIMFGCPIQHETEAFVLNNFFKKIYNIYSDEDVIQDLDVFSTKKESKRRIKIIKKVDLSKIPQRPQIVQLKVMNDREMQKTIINAQKTFSLNTTNTQQNKQSESFWRKLFSPSRLFYKKEKDPTHKELWFISWDKFKEDSNQPLEYLPSVIFTPLILKSIENITSQINDIDINIRFTKKYLKVYAFKHKEKIKTLKNKASVPKAILNNIKDQLLKWAPNEISIQKQFDLIKSYQAKN